MKQKVLFALIVLCAACPSNGDELQIYERNPDPYGYTPPGPRSHSCPR